MGILHCSDLGVKPLFATGIKDVNATNLEGSLGQPRITGDGRRFRWVKCDTAITAGQVVAATALIAASTVTTAATTTSLDVFTTVSTTVAYGPGDFIYITTGTGYGQMAEIDHVPAATQIKLATALTTALTTNSEVAIWRPFVVKPTITTGSLTINPIGVAQVAVATTTPYFWMQTHGPGIALLDCSEETPLVNAPIVCSTALAGAVCGIEPGVSTTQGQINEVTRIVGRVTWDAGYDTTVPVLLTIE